MIIDKSKMQNRAVGLDERTALRAYRLETREAALPQCLVVGG